MSRDAPPSTCLFLPELPADLTDQVLERHFRGFLGFTSCRTRHDRNGKLVGFLEFEQIENAIACRERMQGTSPFPGINWHIHFSNNAKGGAPLQAAKRPRDEMGPPVPRHEAQRQSFGYAFGRWFSYSSLLLATPHSRRPPSRASAGRSAPRSCRRPQPTRAIRSRRVATRLRGPCRLGALRRLHMPRSPPTRPRRTTPHNRTTRHRPAIRWRCK